MLISRILVSLSLVFICSFANASGHLPVEHFASLPDVGNVRLSPNGKKILSLVRLDAQGKQGTAIQVLNAETGELERPLFADNKKYEINWVRWGNDQYVLMSAKFPAVRYGTPTTETRLLSLDLTTGKLRNIIPKRFYKRFDFMPQIQDSIVSILPSDEDHFLLELGGFATGGYTVYKAAIDGSKLKTVQKSRKHVRDWRADRQGRIRIGIFWEDTDYKIIHRGVDQKKWKTLWEFESFSENQVWPIGFDQDPNTLYVKALHNGFSAIFTVDLDDPELKKTLVYSKEEYDVNASLIYSSVAKKVIGITTSEGSGYTFWDSKYVALQNGINKALPDTDNYFFSMSEDEQQYVLFSTNVTNPGVYYYGDRNDGSLVPFAKRYMKLEPENLVEKKSVSYNARDGLEIEGYLTLPKGHQEGDRHPTVIFPHGGPISHDGSGFDYWTQFFANRGYAVLQMNFRGSSGYGHDFMKAGLKNWGLAMQDDVADGTKWMIDNGYADPKKICIVGASYGGYAALMGAVKTPDLYKCSVSFAGVTDVARLVKKAQRYLIGKVAKEQIGSKYGDLKKHSPVKNAEAINVPVLLIHGEEDRIVDVGHSRKMNKTLKKKKKDVTYLELEEGSHYLSINANRVATFKAMDEFLQKHLN